MSSAPGASRSVLVVRADSPAGRAAVARFDAAGDRVYAVEGEPSDPRSRVDSLTAAVDALGGIDVLVVPGPAAVASSFPPHAGRSAIDGGLRTPFFWAQEAARSMTSGRMVLVAPARIANASAPAPATLVEGGLIALVRLLAVELAPRGIGVNAVCPIASDVRPNAVAALIEFLASSDASYMTGALLPMFGAETGTTARRTRARWAARTRRKE
jgi:NAD(P)-dependent dehydrogenase (short-subunit alcohol dehydrogenase family)